jgi:mono/diheme cytochrome c family protein
MLAEINVTAVLLLALGGLLVVLAFAAIALRQRTKGEGPEVPRAMRPGPSDTALETPVLQRLQGWGVVLVVFFVAWWPAQWLFEPGINEQQEHELVELGTERGALAVLPFSEENQLGVGCVRCHGPELKGGAIYAFEKYWNPPNLTDVCGGPWTGHSRITSQDDLYTIIEQGLGDDNPMPSWSIRYKGALPDQQINDIVLYLISINEETVPPEQNVCTNEDASKLAIEAAATGQPVPPEGAVAQPSDGEAA